MLFFGPFAQQTVDTRHLRDMREFSKDVSVPRSLSYTHPSRNSSKDGRIYVSGAVVGPNGCKFFLTFSVSMKFYTRIDAYRFKFFQWTSSSIVR
jgi:hypothetical protein